VVQRQTSEQNVLLDAAGELTQAFAARMQQRGVKERTILTGGALAGLSREVRHKALEHTRLGKPRGKRSGDEERESGEGGATAQGDLARAILKRPDRIRQFAEESDGDPTAQFLLLLDAADEIESGQAGPDAGGAAAAAVREVLEEMFAERGESILADVNTVEVYSRLSADQAREFRSAYHDAVIGADSLGGVVSHLLRLVNDGGAAASFLDAHRAMIAALGLDLAASRPSTDKTRLQSLVSDLYHLEVVSTLLEASGELSGQLRARHGTAPFAPHQLTSDLVSLSGERWVDADHFKRLADRYRAMDPLAATVDFLTGVRNLVKEIPVKVFATPEARQTLIDAAQDAVDYAIDREEGIVE
jgi:type III secretion protein W